MTKEHFTVQMVKHVNYITFVEASSPEEAEQLAAEYTNHYSWGYYGRSSINRNLL